MKGSLYPAMLALAGLFISQTAGAQDRDKKGTQNQTPRFEQEVSVTEGFQVRAAAPGELLLTFSGPVAIPGVGLAPGTYVFALPLGWKTAPGALRVSNLQGAIYGNLLTIPIMRDEYTNMYEVVFREAPSEASPQRIKAVFWPGEVIGHELIYRK